uniref:C2H2-type domain-containing protein n=1 Tax=Trichuris muris TaxID=70415 RepID=A0A5S6QFL4_TRIMR
MKHQPMQLAEFPKHCRRKETRESSILLHDNVNIKYWSTSATFAEEPQKLVYFCYLCSRTFKEPLNYHFLILHHMNNPMDYVLLVKVMVTDDQ